MQQRFLSNLILILALNLLVKPFYLLGIDAEVQARVGTESYGLYFSLVNLSFLLNFLLDFGINNYNTRQVAHSGSVQRDRFSGILLLRSGLALVYMLILLSVGVLLGYQGYTIYLLFILGINQALSAFLLFFRSNLSGMHLFRQDSFMSVLDRILLILLIGALLLFPILGEPFKIEWFIYAQTFTYGLSALIAFFLVYRHIPSLRLEIDLRQWKQLLISSAPYALLTFMMMAYHRLDGIMLERMLDDDANQAGIYARAYRFFDAASMIAYLFAVLLLPMFTRAIKEKSGVEDLANISIRVLFSGAWIIGIIAYFFSDELVGLKYSDQQGETAAVFGFLLLGFVAYATTYIYGTLITAGGKMRILNILAFVGVLINFSLNFILIPKYGAHGSAIATLISQIIAATAQFIAAKSIFKLRNNYRLIAGAVLFVGLSWVIGMNISLLGDDWIVQLFSLLLASIALSWLVGLFPIRSMLGLLRSRVDSGPIK